MASDSRNDDNEIPIRRQSAAVLLRKKQQLMMNLMALSVMFADLYLRHVVADRKSTVTVVTQTNYVIDTSDTKTACLSKTNLGSQNFLFRS